VEGGSKWKENKKLKHRRLSLGTWGVPMKGGVGEGGLGVGWGGGGRWVGGVGGVGVVVGGWWEGRVWGVGGKTREGGWCAGKEKGRECRTLDFRMENNLYDEEKMKAIRVRHKLLRGAGTRIAGK